MRYGLLLILCALIAVAAHFSTAAAAAAEAPSPTPPPTFTAASPLPSAQAFPHSSAGASPTPDSLAWSTDSSQPNRFLAAHGRRSAMFGYSEQGLEAWAYPIQIFRSYFPSFRPRNDSSAIDGQAILRRVIYRPESVTRIYVGPEFVVRERIFVPLDAPGAIVTYEVNGERPVDIIVHFTPVLDLMWPAGSGGQETLWNERTQSYQLQEPTHRFQASVGSPDVVSHDDTQNYAETVGRPAGLAFTIRPRAPNNTARVVIAGGTVAKQLLETAAELEKSATDHYATLLSNTLQIDTPDPQVNRALSWAEVALDQAWVCNPDLGCGVVGGYGASRKARRPQYDWFFAGDGLVTIGGLLATGRYERAREELEFIIKFRNPTTGMIWHEMSQGAPYLDWDHYPYKFVHVDLTFDFLDSLSHYLAVTGDRAFISRNWALINASYRYCHSLLNPHDGLPRIPTGKQGANEQDVLSDDLALSAAWVSAAEGYANLAAATGHDSEAKRARSTSQQAREAASRRYWDTHQNIMIGAYNSSGSPITDPDAQPVSALRSSLFTPQQRDSLLDQLSAAGFQSDWGTRSKSALARSYLPNSYGSGSVWGLGSSGASNAFWGAHRPLTAFPIWNAIVSWASLDSLGHLPETLAGDYYHEELESVPEQTWSSAGFLAATVNGLLGLRVASGAQNLTFAPHLPASWSGVTLRHIYIGAAEVSLRMTQAEDEIRLQVQNSGGTPVHLSFAPELPLGATLRDARVSDRAVNATIERNPQDTHAQVAFDAPGGNTSVNIRFQGGVRIIPTLATPQVGDSSAADKITSVNLKDQVLTIQLDRLASMPSSFQIRTPWKVRYTYGGTLEPVGEHSYRIAMPARQPAAGQPASGSQNYQREKVTLTLANTDDQAPQP
jgi:glycogen debranching enzyme